MVPMTPEEVKEWRQKRRILSYAFLSSLGMFLSLLAGSLIAKL